ncbi:hypothetical protein ABG067_004780 [Albugo candida]
MVLPNKLPGGMGELILNRDVMSRLGLCPRRLVVESCRHSPVFDLQSDDTMQAEKGPLEAVLTVGTDKIEEDASSELKTEEAWAAGCPAHTSITGKIPHVNVAPLSVRLREGAERVRRKARKYPPEYREFMENTFKNYWRRA